MLQHSFNFPWDFFYIFPSQAKNRLAQHVGGGCQCCMQPGGNTCRQYAGLKMYCSCESFTVKNLFINVIFLFVVTFKNEISQHACMCVFVIIAFPRTVIAMDLLVHKLSVAFNLIGILGNLKLKDSIPPCSFFRFVYFSVSANICTQILIL